MPRIDPHQLLSCLTVLLTPTGGILSENEVKRLANLMTKFSKKLVSKCVYVLILRNTDPPLLGSFMVEGGWNLVHVWLQDGYNNKNWALVSELLELLLMSPTTVEQLKTNNLPKLVKSLSKRDDIERVKDLANQLVQKWLKIVKEDQNQNNQIAAERVQAQNVQVVTANSASLAQPVEVVDVPVVQVEPESIAEKPESESCKADEVVEEPTVTSENTQACYKLDVRDGKHILCKVPPNEANVTVVENAIIEDITPVQETAEKSVVKNEIVDIKEEKELENKEPIELEKKKEKSNHDRQKAKHRRSSSRSSSSSSKSSKDKDKKSSRSSSRDKSKDKIRSSKRKGRSSRDSSKERSDKEKHRNNGSLKSSSSSGKNSSSNNKESDRDKEKTKKETKEKQAEKDKDTLNKIQPQVLQKIGRIPKKNSEDGKEEKKEETKKPSFSIEVRKNSEEKPKTVKVFNAKMRSTGLLEEAKPPPPRPVKKTTTATVLPTIPAKRPSPIRDLIPPPEKKVKIEPAERPGAIKLIPPKPKPPVLQESDIFMDALAASATAKKEPKKRKRRISTSKDTNSPPTSPSTSTALTNGATAAPNTSPMVLRSIPPPNFYQDTLTSTEDGDAQPKEETDEKSAEEVVSENPPPTPTDDEMKMEIGDEPPPLNESGLRGVLVHVKRKGPKKSLKWKPEADLVEVQYFELDETERVNVSKPFGDMARMEITSEKHALQMRRIHIDDNMSVQMPWRMLIEIDLKIPLAEPGSKSLEKDIQFAREKSFIGMSPLMHRYAESPAEPDVQQYQVTDPVIIPLEDPESTDPDAPAQLWPEPKGSPPHVPMANMPAMYPTIQQGPFQNFPGPPPPNFSNVPFNPPNFVPPNMMGGGPPNVGPPGNPPDWNNMNNPMNNVNNMNNMNMNMNNGPPMMPPNLPPPEMMNQGPPMFPPKHPENFNHNMNEFPPFNQPNLFPQNNFNIRGGRGGFRRGGGNGPWVRMNGPGPGPGGWNQRGGGGMNRGGRMCKNVKMHGYCRNRDNCHFFHPN